MSIYPYINTNHIIRPLQDSSLKGVSRDYNIVIISMSSNYELAIVAYLQFKSLGRRFDRGTLSD
jgi:hypothetical protein